MKKVFSIILVLIILLITGCDAKVDKLYFEIYDINNELYAVTDEDNNLLLKKDIIYQIKILGWSNSKGIIDLVDPEILNIYYDKSLIYLEQKEEHENQYFFYSKVEGSVNLEFNYKDINKVITLNFNKNDKGIISENIYIIPHISLLFTFDKKSSDIDNNIINVKTSPLEIDKFIHEKGIEVSKSTSSKVSRSDTKLNYLCTSHYNKISNYQDISPQDFSKFYTLIFKEDLQKLKNNEIEVKDIYDKYGTDIIVHTASGIYFDIKFIIKDYDNKIQFNLLSNAIKKVITDIDTYQEQEIYFKQANLEVNITSSVLGDTWIKQLKNFNEIIKFSQDVYQERILESIPLYSIVDDEVLYTKLRKYYHDTF